MGLNSVLARLGLVAGQFFAQLWTGFGRAQSVPNPQPVYNPVLSGIHGVFGRNQTFLQATAANSRRLFSMSQKGEYEKSSVVLLGVHGYDGAGGWGGLQGRQDLEAGRRWGMGLPHRE